MDNLKHSIQVIATPHGIPIILDCVTRNKIEFAPEPDPFKDHQDLLTRQLIGLRLLEWGRSVWGELCENNDDAFFALRRALNKELGALFGLHIVEKAVEPSIGVAQFMGLTLGQPRAAGRLALYQQIRSQQLHEDRLDKVLHLMRIGIFIEQMMGVDRSRDLDHEVLELAINPPDSAGPAIASV